MDKVKRRNMGGTQGNISIGGVETRSVDGQIVMLSGGYHKEGSGHKAVVWTVGLLLLWPVLFVPGGNAELPPGTVFDVATVNALRFEVAPVSNQRVVDLSGLAGGFDAEFMLDDFLDQPKHDTFKIKISLEGALPSKFVIDNVNGKSVEPLTLAVSDIQSKEGRTSAIAAIGAKALAKHFARGINRFEVAYDDGGVRKAAEVVMDVQM
ncbi:hypothetical protein DMC25_09225 [Caulobacter sp. D4A]|nr:hypothetical protein DMC18_21280 [Caulobacter sp. D5]PXA89607.1 hypothetical protein DMC25_09225 [Caulobacter sp. D4A]